MIVPTQPGLGVTLSENVPGWTQDSAKFGKHAGLSPTNSPSIQCDHSAGRSKQADFFRPRMAATYFDSSNNSA